MNVHQPVPKSTPHPTERWTLTRTLVQLWPYIWPVDRSDLKFRVVAAMALLFVAKLATVAVPFTFKWATDALTGNPTAPIEGSWFA
jgi:ATP-binding cassette, subfamily B, heavy metal transporter